MPNTRAFCDMEGNDHALVPPAIEVRDNLGVLAVHVLAAKEDLSVLSYDEMLEKSALLRKCKNKELPLCSKRNMNY